MKACLFFGVLSVLGFAEYVPSARIYTNLDAEEQSGLVEAKDSTGAYFLTDRKKLWCGGVVPISFDFKTTTKAQRNLFISSMKDISKKSCVKFVAKTPNTRDFVKMRMDNKPGSCGNSKVGRAGKEQILNIVCPKKATVTHELLHALGFKHEHKRNDRDHYIDVRADKLQGALAHNNRKDREKVSTSQGKYDYHSLMHYSSGFRKKGSKSWASKGREQMTALDIAGLNRMYCTPSAKKFFKNTKCSPISGQKWGDSDGEIVGSKKCAKGKKGKKCRAAKKAAKKCAKGKKGKKCRAAAKKAAKKKVNKKKKIKKCAKGTKGKNCRAASKKRASKKASKKKAAKKAKKSSKKAKKSSKKTKKTSKKGYKTAKKGKKASKKAKKSSRKAKKASKKAKKSARGSTKAFKKAKKATKKAKKASRSRSRPGSSSRSLSL